jgi:lipopolysaccharide export system permease protein
LQDNFIIAESGVMRISQDRRYLEMDLYNGWRYEEKGQRTEKSSDFIRIGFKEFSKQFDISTLIFRQTADSVNKNNQKMLNMRQLQKVIDSLQKKGRSFGSTGFSQSFSGLQFVKYFR